MFNYILYSISFMLIFIATDIGRNKECRVNIFSFNWFLQIALVTFSVFILINKN